MINATALVLVIAALFTIAATIGSFIAGYHQGQADQFERQRRNAKAQLNKTFAKYMEG